MKSISLLFALLLCSFSVAAAQTQKTTRKKPTKPKPSVNDATRVRRADQKTTAPAETPAEVKPEATNKPQPVDADPKPEEKSTATAPESTAKTPELAATPAADPITDLKTQIGEANDGAEKIRLELKLAEELVSQGNKAESMSVLHTITNTDAFDPQTFYNTGNALARLGDNDGAIDAYRKAIEQRKGGYSRALNNLGVVFLRVGRWDESHQALSSAVKLENFRYPEASYNLGRLYAARGQTDLAVREWKRVLALDPKHAGAIEALAHLASGDGVVVEQAKNSSTSNPGSVTTSASSRSAASSNQLTKAVALDAASYNYLQQARSLNEKGNALAAIENYQRLLGRQNGYFPLANLEMSFALLSLKRYDEALSNLQMVAERDGSRYPISYFHLARLYETKGDLKQAENWFSRAVTAFGNKNNQFLLDVSRVREKQGNYSGALQAMEQYVAVMQQQGLAPSWSDERLTALKQKVAAKQ